MSAALDAARQQARRDLHREMSVPALYIVGTEDPVDVTVRRQTRVAKTGDIEGLDTAEISVETVFLRFLIDELAQPKRNAIVSVAEGEAYRIDHALAPHGVTIDAAVTRLDTAEATGLPLPSVP
jgi:hypothetical protein